MQGLLSPAEASLAPASGGGVGRLFGMTLGEIGLVCFDFGLIYVAALVPRLGAYVGRTLARRSTEGSLRP